MTKRAGFLFIIILFFITACIQGEQKIKIGYVQITQDPVLNTAKKGLFQALTDSGFVNGENVKIIDNNANGDLSMIITILQSFQSQGVDLIITNSTPCMVSAAQVVQNIPIVFTVSFGPEQVKLKTVPDNLYGVYDPYDVKSHVSIMQSCLPNLKRVGLPYNNAEVNAEYSARTVTEELKGRGIEVIQANVNSSNDLIMAAQYLQEKNIDALLATADNTVYQGLGVLVKAASESKIPLFVTDAIQAEKGASIGMGVNYERWGYLSGLKAIEILKGRKINNRIEAMDEKELLINYKACNAQGLEVPTEISEQATKIINN